VTQQRAVKPAPPPPAPEAPPPRKLKLAVLPVEKLLLPKVAEALNDRLMKASMGGVTETSPATISMEVALMQLDCAQPGDQCYGQIAKHFSADRLLWAEIARAAKAKKKKASTTIRIVVFDAERASVIGKAEQTFPGDVTNDALDQLLGQAITEADGQAGGTAPPPAAQPGLAQPGAAQPGPVAPPPPPPPADGPAKAVSP
jgi:hypothetical protein